jgi:ABC-type transport system involved in multi-copper enzyme maturation permease subunit
MRGSIRAELLLLRKRPSTWILLGMWATLAVVFAYAVAYVEYVNGTEGQVLGPLLPDELVGKVLQGFPFFGGVLALMLGVLTFGGEYGFGTWKTAFTQGPGRMHVYASKLVAVGLALVPFVLVVFGLGSVASTAIAFAEGGAVTAPAVGSLVGGMAAGWLILAVWAAFGAALAVLFRGTALATGVGILYAFVVEGLLSALTSQVGFVDRLAELFLRANGYSLVTTAGVSREEIADAGPGSFVGPFVGGTQALVVLGAYGLAFVLVCGWLLRRRDVT